MLELSPYTIRYYDSVGLIPSLCRTEKKIRLFSDHTISWLRLVHCLRMTGLPIERVKHYIDLCLQGDETIPERAEMIFRQESILREQIRVLKKQMEVLKFKKQYYQELLNNSRQDKCNPANQVQQEPNIMLSVDHTSRKRTFESLK